MNKKKGLAICSVLSCAIVGAAVFASLSSNFVKAQAEDVVYKLNTVNFDGVFNGASGNKFNGVDGYHFEVSSNPDTTKDYAVVLHNFGGDWTLPVNKEFKYSVEFKVDSIKEGKEGFNVVVSSRWQGGNPDVDGIYKEVNYGADDVGKYLKIESTFVTKIAQPEIEVHFGKNEAPFNAFVRRVEVKDAATDEVVAATYLEAPGEFKNRWNNAHKDQALCDASDEEVRALLKLYSELPTWARNDLRNMDALYPVEGKGNKIGDQIDYFAERVHVSFED